MKDRCMSRKSSEKTAGGITIYLLEELGDARLRCAQLKVYIREATELIEKSEKRDDFFEVAAHLIHGIPDTVFRMEKALNAAAMAAARIDYEEVKNDIRPEKADELEAVLPDIRLRYLDRRSEKGPETMLTPKQAADAFTAIADQTEATGKIPLDKVTILLAKLEGNHKRASTTSTKAASVFRQASADILASKAAPSRLALANLLRNVLADQMQPTSAQLAAAIYQTASSRDEVMKGFKESNPALTDAQLTEIADNWEKNKDNLK